MENRKHGSMVSIASSASGQQPYSNRPGSATSPLQSSPPVSPLNDRSHRESLENSWRIPNPNSPRIISETARYIIEHYSPTEPYNFPSSTSAPTHQFNLKQYHLEHCDHDNDDPYVYRSFFYGREHKNLLGFHPDLGSLSISVRKELDKSKTGSSYLYRGILRTAEKFTYVVKTEPELNLTTKQRLLAKISTKDVLIALFPVCETAKLKEIDDPKLAFELLTIEEKMVEKNYKFGVVYCKPGQLCEDDMLSNERGSSSFDAFLRCIGESVRLKGYKGFRGGLDVKDDTTGTESVASTFRNMKVMYHVSTMLPYSPQNRQQIQRKAQIGNDICIIVFKEAGDSPYPFNPAAFVTQFTHVFIVVEEVNCADGVKRYRVATARKEDVPAFGPYPPTSGYFELNNCLREFIIAKLINGENAAYQSVKFSQLRTRTRKSLLEDLTKTFLRKASLGSTSSLSTWKSLFGTTDNLAGRVSVSNTNLNIVENVFKSKTHSLNPPPKDEMIVRRKSIGAKEPHMYEKPRRTSSPASSPVNPGILVDLIDKNPDDNLFSPTKDSYQGLSPENSAPTSPVQDKSELTVLREENILLKRKLEIRAAEHVDSLLAQQSELKVKIELHETKIKLLKALAFIESLSGDGAAFVKQAKDISK